MTRCTNCGENAEYITDTTEAILNITEILREVNRLRNIEKEYEYLQYEMHDIKKAISDLGVKDQVELQIEKNKDDIPF